MKKKQFFRIFVLSLTVFFFPQLSLFPDVVEEAQEVFMENKPKEAIPLLRTALEKEPNNENLYMYLGIAYEQLQDWEEAIESYQKGLSTGKERAAFLYNIANNYARMGKPEKAEASYTSAIESGENIAEAYLNRANLRVKIEEYEEAVADYKRYLSQKPKASQRENIEKMISLLSEKMRIAEKERREEEQRKREEEERQQALLDQVLSSLEESSGETKNLSAGTGDVKEYEGDFDIVE